MGLLKRLTHDLRAGLVSLRYGTAQAATRALEEAELLRVRLELRKLDERIQELCGEIGERALDLYERGASADRVVADSGVKEGAERVKVLREARERLLNEMEEIRNGS